MGLLSEDCTGYQGLSDAHQTWRTSSSSHSARRIRVAACSALVLPRYTSESKSLYILSRIRQPCFTVYLLSLKLLSVKLVRSDMLQARQWASTGLEAYISAICSDTDMGFSGGKPNHVSTHAPRHDGLRVRQLADTCVCMTYAWVHLTKITLVHTHLGTLKRNVISTSFPRLPVLASRFVHTIFKAVKQE